MASIRVLSGYHTEYRQRKNSLLSDRQQFSKRDAFVLSMPFIFYLFTGCLAVNSYVDPTLPKATAATLVARDAPAPLSLHVEFLTQGKPNVNVTRDLYNRISEVLRSSGLFSEVRSSSADNIDRLYVVMNNVGDRGGAAAKGVGTGLTFGLVGSMVTDGYLFTATYNVPRKLDHGIS